jgi:hypothetical protein
MKAVWKNRENGFALQLKKTNPDTGELEVLTSDEMDDISKIEILYKGVKYDSATYDTSFDWSTYKASGVVVFKLGLITTIATGRDKRVELIIYNTANPLGLIWKLLDIKVKLEA